MSVPIRALDLDGYGGFRAYWGHGGGGDERRERRERGHVASSFFPSFAVAFIAFTARRFVRLHHGYPPALPGFR